MVIGICFHFVVGACWDTKLICCRTIVVLLIDDVILLTNSMLIDLVYGLLVYAF